MTEKLLYWFLALSASLLFVFYHVAIALPRAYGTDAFATAAPAAALVAVRGGAWLALRGRARSGAMTAALTSVSLVSTASAYVLWFAFDRGLLASIALPALAAIAGLGSGVTLAVALRAYGRSFAELGLMSAALNPLRAAGSAAAFLAVLATFPYLGLLRVGALLGALLGCVTLFVPIVDDLLDRQNPGRAPRFAAAAVIAGALFATTAASRFVPLSDVHTHAGDVLYVLDGPRGRHVVTRVQRALLLFTNDVLVTTSADGARFAEALVHPALGVRASLAGAPTGRHLRVLVFSNGSGAVEREIQRHSSVARVTSVVPDRRLAELGGASTAFTTLGGAPPSSAQAPVTRIEAEAAPFVAARSDRFDVILADLGDPTSYVEGKHYTRHFFGSLLRVLEPGGVLALQLTSPLRTPGAHASVLATLRAAGFAAEPYRAPLPTLGEWGFALAYAPALTERVQAALAAPRVPSGTALLTASNLRDLFVVPPATAPLPPAIVNYLYDQPVVGLYQEEERRHWE